MSGQLRHRDPTTCLIPALEITCGFIPDYHHLHGSHGGSLLSRRGGPDTGSLNPGGSSSGCLCTPWGSAVVHSILAANPGGGGSHCPHMPWGSTAVNSTLAPPYGLGISSGWAEGHVVIA